jgi:uncharacterized protein
MLTVEKALNLIKTNKKVAIVGLSPKEDRPSNRVAKFLLEQEFEITPVNPVHEQILERPVVKNLSALNPGDVDWIDLFVNPHRLADLTEDIIRLSPKLIWCQIGVVNDEFNQELEKAGIPYIANVCPKIEWK